MAKDKSMFSQLMDKDEVHDTGSDNWKCTIREGDIGTLSSKIPNGLLVDGFKHDLSSLSPPCDEGNCCT